MRARDDYRWRGRADRVVDYRKTVSDHVAIALIVYTGLNIFLTVEAIKETGARSLSMLCLILLVTAIIPACHKFEKRWRILSIEEARRAAAAGQFSRDLVKLWVTATALPVGLTAAFKLFL